MVDGLRLHHVPDIHFHMQGAGYHELPKPPRIANAVYAEVVPREITLAAQSGLVQETAWNVDADGVQNLVQLLSAFHPFFREHSQHKLFHREPAYEGTRIHVRGM